MGEFELLAAVMVCAAFSLAGVLALRRHAENRLYKTAARGPLVREAQQNLDAAGVLWSVGVFALMIYVLFALWAAPAVAVQGALWCAAALFGVFTPVVAVRGWYLARLAWR